MDHSIIYRSSPIILKAAFRSWASVLSGVLMFAAFPRLNWHPLVWVACLPLLATLVSERSLARAFWLGYLTGAVFLAGSCYWFIGVMERYGRLAPLLAVGVWLLFVVVFAAFFGVFGLMEGWVARRSVRRALTLSPFHASTLVLASVWNSRPANAGPAGRSRGLITVKGGRCRLTLTDRQAQDPNQQHMGVVGPVSPREA